MRFVVMVAACLFGGISFQAAHGGGLNFNNKSVEHSSYQSNVIKAIDAIRNNDFEKAQKIILEGLSLEPQNARLHLLNAMCFHRLWLSGQTDFKELARTGYQIALSHDGALWPAAWMLGVIAAGDGNNRQAAEYYAQALLLQRKVNELKLDYAQSNYLLGRPQVALAALDSTAMDNLAVTRGKIIAAAASNQYEKTDYLFDEFLKKSGNELEIERIKARVHELNEGFQYASLKTGYAANLQGSTTNALISDSAVMVAQGNDLMRALRERQKLEEQKVGNSLPQQNSEEIQKTSSKSSRMALIDAAILITEENYSSSQGVNLLSGLQLMLGSADQPFYQRIQQTGNVANNIPSYSFSRTISIPSVIYALNIANIGTQKTEIIARPTLVALDGMESKFSNGSRISLAMNGQYGGNLEDRDVGLQISVTPTFVDDRRIQLAINVNRSFFVPVVEDVKANAGSSSFQISQTQVSSNVEVNLDDTIILSGLTEKINSSARDATPILGDIPLVQYAFSQRTIDKTATSVMVMLTPRSPVLVNNVADNVSKPGAMESRLQDRYPEWFHFSSAPNWVEILNHLQSSNTFFYQFRKGDLFGEHWDVFGATNTRLQKIMEFIYY